MVAGKVVVTLEHNGVAPKQFVPCPNVLIVDKANTTVTNKKIYFFKTLGFY